MLAPQRRKTRIELALAPVLTLCLPALCPAAESQPAGGWADELRANVWDPWFVFGMGAQGLFFLRFIIQWIVSEKRKRSTIPIAFWYLSLAGAVSTFVYAVHEAQPVFMLGQALACVIYIRNLMLIYSHAQRRRQAGLPVEGRDEPVPGEGEMADNGP